MVSKFSQVIIALGAICSLSACVEDPGVNTNNELLVSSEGRYEQSSSVGNLFATALQKEYDLDFAFVPSSNLLDQAYTLIEPGMEPELTTRRVLSLMDASKPRWKEYKLGTMKGSAIKDFIVSRTLEMQRHELHVAGMHYSFRMVGGFPDRFIYLSTENGDEIQDSRYYRVAIDATNYRTFPGYWFAHGMSRSFREETKTANLEQALTNYLAKIQVMKPFDTIRSRVIIDEKSEISGITPISKVQGISHMSELLGHIVTVEGVVTVLGTVKDGFHKGRKEAYIQSVTPDDDPRSSEGIYLDLGYGSLADVEVGSLIRVKGTVYEELAMNEGLSRTGIRKVQSVDVIPTPTPYTIEPVVLGGDSLVNIPNKRISTYFGNINRKPALNLEDGIDFWESLEGMKIVVKSPRVVGFAGGKKDVSEEGRPKGYISVFVVAEGTANEEQKTPVGGLMIDNLEFDYNPEIIRIVDHHLAPKVTSSKVFEVGDMMKHDLEGVFGYEKNLFGGGEYTFFVTGQFEGTQDSTPPTPEQKPQSKLAPEEDKLTVATFNVENLTAGKDAFRFDRLGRTIAYNLHCPDIINLVEIQDDDGAFGYTNSNLYKPGTDDTVAEKTLMDLITNIRDCPNPAEYKFVNVDPVKNQEGGEPGGNIRVAMIYNSLRVGFNPKGEPGPISNSYLAADGSLLQNPGRLNHEELEGTRRPLVAEFTFKGERIFVIGNHFNSKGGDTSLWSADQPPVLGSSDRRSKIADVVNDFVELILRSDKNANVIVTGDFNDFNESRAMQVLEGGGALKNLANVKKANGEPIIQPNDVYTYNYGGNSQPLDFILVSPALLRRQPEVDALHINTDFMGQVADHDPVISRFTFD
ncbi:5'-nucleotidase C-terminal domain-containing protein [Pseudobacteriovorax antillogorgiicola]|uniref:Predicted extracellular nuclease n=1 Tax=Pseudobacteriovorax antillogorgiicola TaxID=1513793 RepID=A0A1Y6CQD4_9BACT|nr:endonuclease/exonuclease/phosphatase family protein [Pseudobacteriovorax antillogorgiicola]TCS46339.1 putative extracellular nuclease [Pseudobacteriovorax antillogorgiicola]SMF68012.1 Predicted extracellular nuclease [Pseudobacteriovorax antillogorgiicola]